MPTKGYRKKERAERRLKVRLTPAVHERVQATARNAGLTTSDYIRNLIDTDTAKEDTPKRGNRNYLNQNLLAEAHHVGVVIKALVPAVERLVREAETQRVPIKPETAQELHALTTLALDKAIALFSRIKP